LKSLFIDTTYDISLGILNENWAWDEFETFNAKKASEIIQSQTHELLVKSKTNISEIENVFSVAGPGFYTGLRLSEGFSDVLTFSGKKAYSFYAYHIPKLLGVTEGLWGTKAYRGEYFFHQWGPKESKNILLSAKEVKEFSETFSHLEFFIHCDSAIDELMRDCFQIKSKTVELLKANPEKVFPQINEKVDSFYFRAPEDEFKVNP